VINLCDEEEQAQLLDELVSGIQLDNGITITVGDIEISVHSNELSFDELEVRLFSIIDKIEQRFKGSNKNYMNYTS
jgi:hypothetical protein